MKIAVPLADGRLANRFGHCTSFALFDVNPDRQIIIRRHDVPSPEHQPDRLPEWLAECGVGMVIAQGMGKRAMALLGQHRIGIVTGAETADPESLVRNHLAGTIEAGGNPCDGCLTVRMESVP